MYSSTTHPIARPLSILLAAVLLAAACTSPTAPLKSGTTSELTNFSCSDSTTVIVATGCR